MEENSKLLSVCTVETDEAGGCALMVAPNCCANAVESLCIGSANWNTICSGPGIPELFGQ